jgi:transposase
LTKIWLKLGMKNNKSTKRYPTDLSDAGFAVLEPLRPPPAKRGRKPTPWRTVLNAIFSVLRSGGAWRLLPKCFPPWQTVYEWFRRWQRAGLWQQWHDALRARLRQHSGKQRQPSAAIVDSQSVKFADQRGCRGYDAGKKAKSARRRPRQSVDANGIYWWIRWAWCCWRG